MTQSPKFYSLLFVILLGVTNAGADPIHDNGPPNNLDGYEMTHWLQADDLDLGLASRLENVKLWTFEGAGSFQGSIVWQVYSNSASNTPGVLLLSGSSTNVTHEPTGFVLAGYAEFVTTFDIAPTVLPAGVYWLILHNGPLTYTTNLGRTYWETTNRHGPVLSQSRQAPFTGTWFGHNIPPGSLSELAFQINGVPGPRITTIARLNNAPRVSFTTTSGQLYRLEYKNSLTDPGWSPVVGVEDVAGTGGVVTVIDPDPDTHTLGRRLYRARLCPCQTIEGPKVVAFDFDAAPRITFTTVAGKLYRVEYKADLKSALWTPLPGAELIGGTGQVVRISDIESNGFNPSRRFYRAVLVE